MDFNAGNETSMRSKSLVPVIDEKKFCRLKYLDLETLVTAYVLLLNDIIMQQPTEVTGGSFDFCDEPMNLFC